MYIALCIDSSNKFKGVYQYTKHLMDGINYNIIDKPHSSSIVSVLLNCLKRYKYDIIHIPDFKIYHLPIVLFTKAKVVITLHGGRIWIPPKSVPTFKDKPKAWLFYKLNKIIVPLLKRKVDKWIAVSQFLKDRMVEDLGIESDKIEVIYLAADDMFKNHNIQRDILLSDTPVPELVDLYYGLYKKTKLPLVIFSKREYGFKAFLNRLNELIVECPELKHNVHIVGKVSNEQLLYYYNKSVLYIRIALIETFGIPVLEAMSCGTPVATNMIDSLPEICGDVGFSIDNINLCQLNEQRKLGLERAKQFSWNSTIAKTKELYRKLYM